MKPTRDELFEHELRTLIASMIKEFKREGTVACGLNHLWNLTLGRISRSCPHAPVGTNAVYFIHLVFDRVVKETPAFRRFTY